MRSSSSSDAGRQKSTTTPSPSGPSASSIARVVCRGSMKPLSSGRLTASRIRKGSFPVSYTSGRRGVSSCRRIVTPCVVSGPWPLAISSQGNRSTSRSFVATVSSSRGPFHRCSRARRPGPACAERGAHRATGGHTGGRCAAPRASSRASSASSAQRRCARRTEGPIGRGHDRGGADGGAAPVR